jgi:hypothetical protein
MALEMAPVAAETMLNAEIGSIISTTCSHLVNFNRPLFDKLWYAVSGDPVTTVHQVTKLVVPEPLRHFFCEKIALCCAAEIHIAANEFA